MKHFLTYSSFLLLIAGGILCCTKDKVPVTVISEPSKWDKITGTYNVYDTIGTFLYTMEIKHLQSPGQNGNTFDSLEFVNFHNGYHFKTQQSSPTPSNWPDTYISIQAPNPSLDGEGNSWQLYGFPTNDFKYNVLRDDTIQLRFKRNNILYYLQDMIPYEDSTYRQVAVKQ